MLEFFREHQLNIMLVLAGISGIISLFVLISTVLSPKRKAALLFLELGAMFLLIFDRYAYIYRGDESFTGYWMVRISNFLVFTITLTILGAFNMYIENLFLNEGGLKKTPIRLKVCYGLATLGIIMVIVSQFTGFYYTFDETNHYQRSSGFVICYLIPVLIMILQLSIIIQYGKKLSKGIWLSLILFTVLPIVMALAQLFLYGLSLNNMTIVAMNILLYVFSLIDTNKTAVRVHRQEVEYLKEQQDSMSRLFEKTAVALAEAIDEGKTHMKGHSVRVAKYSREIARISGMNDEDCEKVYFAAILHDVGKILIPDSVLQKDRELTDEEEKIFREHAMNGGRILSYIEEYPYLGDGAKYHHERYDGLGYPEGLKGDDIPEMARIITVADAYDDMAIGDSGQGHLSISRIREELVTQSGSKFDPQYAKAMVYIIDEEPEILKAAEADITEEVHKRELDCTDYRKEISNGVNVSQNIKKIKLKCSAMKGDEGSFSMPAIIFYDSLDGRVHSTERMIMENGYMEYGEIWFDGHTICTRARNIETKFTKSKVSVGKVMPGINVSGTTYEIEVGRYKDHMRMTIKGGEQDVEIIAALPDSTRYTYIALTGENCHITDIDVSETGKAYEEGDIPRIAEEVSYIGRLESDIKNVQIDGYRTSTTESIKVYDGMRIEFHTMSLPTANLVWHCPYVILFNSDDKKVNGNNYREFVLVRLDGEIVESDERTENRMVINKNENFESWDKWKQVNKKGMECVVNFRKRGNKITVTTENSGISIKNTTILDKDVGDVYLTLSGDQCALTDIRVL